MSNLSLEEQLRNANAAIRTLLVIIIVLLIVIFNQ